MLQLEAGPVRTPHPASDELYRAHSRRGVASEQALLAVTRCKNCGFQRWGNPDRPKKAPDEQVPVKSLDFLWAVSNPH